MRNVGTVIRERRKELGLKVYELAKKVGVNPVYITQIEKHNKLPSLDVIKDIIKALDLKQDTLSLYLESKNPNTLIHLVASAEKAIRLSTLQKLIKDINIKLADRPQKEQTTIKKLLSNFLEEAKRSS